MTYDDIPNEDKVKVFEFKRNNEDIKRVEKRVLEIRSYLTQF